MANSRRCSFQCPRSGQDVQAVYAFGKLWVALDDGSVHYEPEHNDPEVQAKTEAWCEQHNGRRFPSADAAATYLEDLGVEGALADQVRYGA